MFSAEDTDERIGVRSRAVRHVLLLQTIGPLTRFQCHSLASFVADFHAKTGLALCALDPSWLLPDGSVCLDSVTLGFCRPLATALTKPPGPRSCAMCLSPLLQGRPVTAEALDLWSVRVLSGAAAGEEPFRSLWTLNGQTLNCLRKQLRLPHVEPVQLAHAELALPPLGASDESVPELLRSKLDLKLDVHEADRVASLLLCSLVGPLQQAALRDEQTFLRELLRQFLHEPFAHVAPGQDVLR